MSTSGQFVAPSHLLSAAPEASTWSARSAARTNDVDTDKRRKTINGDKMADHLTDPLTQTT
jgi:hypothetical protein